MAGSDTNDTDLRTISFQKLANKVREPKTYILVLSLVCLECEIGHLACNTMLGFLANNCKVIIIVKTRIYKA